MTPIGSHGAASEPPTEGRPRVCMHVWNEVRTDERVLRSATALVAAGFDVSILGIERGRPSANGETIRGIHVQHLRVPGWLDAVPLNVGFLVRALWIVVAGTIQLLRTRADVYHAHDSEALPACFIAARLRRGRLVFDAHELPTPLARRWPGLSGPAQWIFSLLLPRRGVITSSPRYADEIRRMYRVPQVTVIRNVPVYREVARSDRLRAHLGLGSETRIALYQGYVQADRGLDRLVLAAAALAPDTMIAIMGKAVPSIQAELEALIERTGVSDRVRLLPPVPYAELLDWTASADIGLVVLPLDYSPSILMTLPNKLFECIMAGLPVLASPLPAVADVITGYGVGRIVQSLEPAAIAEAITSVLADRDALERMHRRALDAARDEFNWEHESQTLIALYRDLVPGKAPVGGPRSQSR